MTDSFTVLTDQGSIHYNEKSMSTFSDIERSAQYDIMTRNVIEVGRANGWSTERTLCAIVSVLQSYCSLLFCDLVDAKSKKPNVVIINGTAYVPRQEQDA